MITSDGTALDDAYRSIACGLYDRFEAAAVERRTVRLVLTDGTALTGRIDDLVSRDDAEWLLLATTDGGGATHTVRLDTIASMDGEDAGPAC